MTTISVCKLVCKLDGENYTFLIRVYHCTLVIIIIIMIYNNYFESPTQIDIKIKMIVAN